MSTAVPLCRRREELYRQEPCRQTLSTIIVGHNVESVERSNQGNCKVAGTLRRAVRQRR